jgi:(2Fe-2S) ferredoxin
MNRVGVKLSLGDEAEAVADSVSETDPSAVISRTAAVILVEAPGRLERGSEAVIADLRARQDAGELADIDVREYIGFSACEKGPNVVCVEDQVWYCGVQPDDVDDIVKAVGDGAVVERLTENTDRVTRNLIFTVLDAGLLPGDI